MTEPTRPAHTIPGDRPVLLWRPDSDASRLEDSLDQAARFLEAPADTVTAAIDKGELLGGWFVDWAADAA